MALRYIESIEDHERFRCVARTVSARKPVITLFGGRTDVEEMAEAIGLLARYPRLRDGTRSDNLSDLRFHDRRGA